MSERSVFHPEAPGAGRLDAFGWAVAFVWVGVAMLANLGWAWMLVGLGAIVLAEQAASKFTRGTTSGVWIGCGLVFLAGGLWQLFGLTLPLTPLLLIALGVIIFLSALLRRPSA